MTPEELEIHREKRAAYMREWRQTPYGQISQRTIRGNYVKNNAEAVRKARNEYRERLRRQVLEGYGGVCNCPGCHVSHAEMLTIDHVRGDGAEERRGGAMTGVYFFLKIIAADFPPNYQALCGSCNLAKGTKDKCPLAGEEH